MSRLTRLEELKNNAKPNSISTLRLTVILGEPMPATDAKGIQKRKYELTTLFTSLSGWELMNMKSRLENPTDPLYLLFHYTLGRSQRGDLLKILSERESGEKNVRAFSELSAISGRTVYNRYVTTAKEKRKKPTEPKYNLDLLPEEGHFISPIAGPIEPGNEEVWVSDESWSRQSYREYINKVNNDPNSPYKIVPPETNPHVIGYDPLTPAWEKFTNDIRWSINEELVQQAEASEKKAEENEVLAPVFLAHAKLFRWLSNGDNLDTVLSMAIPGPKGPKGSRGAGKSPPLTREQFLRIQAGNDFNRLNYFSYPYRELYIRKGGRYPTKKGEYFILDGWIPDKEIVSRKNAQLSDVSVTTGKAYINEILAKYPEGAEIGSVTTSGLQTGKGPSLQSVGGQKLTGRHILEVPAQVSPVPKPVLDHATSKGVTIRDVHGTVYNSSP